jgi:hypothetical protein
MNILFNIIFTARACIPLRGASFEAQRAQSAEGGFPLPGDSDKSKTPSLRLKRKIQLLLICFALPNKIV